jgi:DNA ligase D-like protein (predicted 3'-phosphoesterase)
MVKKDPLAEYQKKRDFRKTIEPSGRRKKKSKRPLFVIQKHDASRLHYDFRLEVDGVLKSWAIPEDPPTKIKNKRLAILTEDHPLDYADFEGTIPEGEYGAGTVLVWDIGTYCNLRAEKEDDGAFMGKSIKEGKVEIWLKGKKTRGEYALIRTGKKKDSRWLLIKMDDQETDARRNPESTEPKSILTGRTIHQIARQKNCKTGKLIDRLPSKIR